MADQQRGDLVKVNGEQYKIMSIKDCSSSGSKFFGKCRFTLRKVSDGTSWEAFGKRVVHNSRLTSVDVATPGADQVADTSADQVADDASGDQVADVTADQVADGFTYVDDCVYATDPATVVDIQAGDTIRIEWQGSDYSPAYVYESTVIAVDRDEFGLYFATVRVILDTTGREPSAFWTETQASTTVHKITRVDGAPSVDVSADDYADALEWARDLYAARSARPAAPSTAAEIVRARRAERDQVADSRRVTACGHGSDQVGCRALDCQGIPNGVMIATPVADDDLGAELISASRSKLDGGAHLVAVTESAWRDQVAPVRRVRMIQWQAAGHDVRLIIWHAYVTTTGLRKPQPHYALTVDGALIHTVAGFGYWHVTDRSGHLVSKVYDYLRGERMGLDVPDNADQFAPVAPSADQASGDQVTADRVREIIAAGTWSVRRVLDGGVWVTCHVLADTGPMSRAEHDAVSAVLCPMGAVWHVGFGFSWENMPATKWRPRVEGARGRTLVAAWLASESGDQVAETGDQGAADASGDQVAEIVPAGDQVAAVHVNDMIIPGMFTKLRAIQDALNMRGGDCGAVTVHGAKIVITGGSGVDTVALSKIMGTRYVLTESGRVGTESYRHYAPAFTAETGDQGATDASGDQVPADDASGDQVATREPMTYDQVPADDASGDQVDPAWVREVIGGGVWMVAQVGRGRGREVMDVFNLRIQRGLTRAEYVAVRNVLRTLGGEWRKGSGFVWHIPATPTGPWDTPKVPVLSGSQRVRAWLDSGDQGAADATADQVTADATADQVATVAGEGSSPAIGADQVATDAADASGDQVADDATAAPVAPAFTQRADIGRMLRKVRSHLGHVTRPGGIIRVSERYGDRIVITGTDIDTNKLSQIMGEPYRLEARQPSLMGAASWVYVPWGRPVPPVSAERDQDASGDQDADADDTATDDTDASEWRSMRAAEEAADQGVSADASPAIDATDAPADQVATDASGDQVADAAPEAVQFTASRDQVADAFAYVAGAAPKRPAVPVLGGALITADASGVTVAGFDYDQARTVRLDARVITPGRVLVPCHQVAEIVKGAAAAVKEITFATDASGAMVTITAGASVYRVATLPVADYPTITPVPARIGTVDVHAFADMIAYVLPAAGKDDTLPMLTCFRLTPGAHRLDIVATNRYLATDAVVTWSRDDDASAEKILISAKPLADALKVIAAGTDAARGEAVIGHGDAVASVSAGRYTFVIRTNDGNSYPPIDKLFPAEYGAAGTVEAKALMDAIKRVMLGAAKDENSVRLTWSADAVTVATTSKATEAGRETGASEAVACSYIGAEGFSFAANPGYLVSLVKTAIAKPSKPTKPAPRGTKVPAPRVTFGAVDSYKTVIITEEHAGAFSPRHLIMPLRTGAAVNNPKVPGVVAAAPGAAMITAPTTRKEGTMPAAPATTDTPAADQVAPATPARKGGKRANQATPATVAATADQAPAAPAAPVFTAEEADQLERIAQDAHDKLTAGDYRGALAAVATGEAMAPRYLVAGSFTWSELRADIVATEAENTPADAVTATADQAPALTPADAVALDAAQEAGTVAMVAAPAKPAPAPATVDQAAPAATVETASHPFRFASYGVTGVSYGAARAAVRDALRAAGFVVRVDKGADKRDAIVVTDAPADQVAAIVSAAAAISTGDDDARPVSGVPAVRPVSAVPSARPVSAVPAVTATATAHPFRLASYGETGITYNAARDAIRDAFRTAGIAARVSKGDDKRDAVVTTDAPADQVTALVAAAAALAVTADA